MIKKLLILITGIVALLLMCSTYDFYNMRYVMKVDSFQDQIAYVEQKMAVPIWIEFTNDDDVYPFMQELIGYAKKNDITIMVATPDNNNTKELLRFSIYTENDKSIQSLYIETDETIAFDEERDSLYYASDPTDTNSAGRIISLDQKYFTLNSRSYAIGTFMSGYDTVLHNKCGEFYFYVDSVNIVKTDLDKIVDNGTFYGEIHLENQFEVTHSADSADINEGYDSNIFPIIISLIFIYILLLIIDVSRKRKELMIMRMQGISVLYILKKQFFLFFLLSLLCFTLVLFAIYLFLSLGKGSITNEMLETILCYPVLLIFCFILLSIPLYFYIKTTTSVQNLKLKNGMDKLLYLNLSMKVLIIVVLLPIFVTNGASALQALENNSEIREHEDILRSLISYNPSMLKFENENDLFTYFMNHDGKYVDFQSYYFSQESYLRSVTDNEDEISSSIIDFPFIYANANYLQDTIIKDIDGNVVDVKAFTEDTLLIPEKYENENLKRICYSTECKKIIIDNPGIFINYDRNSFNDVPTLKNPVIHVITHLGDETSSDLMFLPVSENTDIEAYVKEIQGKYKEKIQFSANEQYLDVFLERNNIEIREFVFVTCVYLVLFAGLLYQYVYICIQETMKEMAILYMLGKNRWYRYKNLLFASVMPYMIPLITGIVLQHLEITSVISIVLCLVFLELLMESIALLIWERKNIANILKGEKYL